MHKGLLNAPQLDVKIRCPRGNLVNDMTPGVKVHNDLLPKECSLGRSLMLVYKAVFASKVAQVCGRDPNDIGIGAI